jgi:acyl-CoA dehydrogenase
MLDDWAINQIDGDLSPEIWDFMREHRFFGMIISKEHGGLGFSAFAHSEVVRRISMVSLPAAVTVMVPNSLGPGELLHLFGTDAQKEHWLPRLADGSELPAFGLTSDEAGSDAASMVDTGVVCRGEWQGKEVIGIRLNWSKRYITLAPVCTCWASPSSSTIRTGCSATNPEPGITCALVPTDLPGGRDRPPPHPRRHDVPQRADHRQGRLHPARQHHRRARLCRQGLDDADERARGRARHLAALPRLCRHGARGAFERRLCAGARTVRPADRQVRRHPGAARPPGRNAYAIDAARRLTCAGLDEGRALAVISAVMKYTATERMRDAVDDAMDIHAGKAVIDGPGNYLSRMYRAVPIGITVEGANIVTRSLMVFGQGAIRAHPHLLDEILALEKGQADEALDEFDQHFWRHVGHSLRTFGRSFGRALTGARFAPARSRRRSRRADLPRALALVGSLCADRRHRLPDHRRRAEAHGDAVGPHGRHPLPKCISSLPSSSAGRTRAHDADFPLVAYNAQRSFARIGELLDAVLATFPARWAALILRVRHPTGQVPRTLGCARRDLRGPDQRARARPATGSRGFLRGRPPSRHRRAQRGVQTRHRDRAPAAKLRKLEMTPQQAVDAGLLSAEEKAGLDAMQEAVARSIAVDDFTPQEMAQLFPGASCRDQE